ncbi:MAG: hypothetical protein AAF985_22855 [Bacteroidota bacterium]
METTRRDRTLDNIHQDVDFANRYRIEYIKHLLSLSGGIFVISIGLLGNDLNHSHFSLYRESIAMGWLALILSMMGGIFHMRVWDKFYMSFRKPHEKGLEQRKRLRLRRRIAEAIQIGFFMIGVILIFLFVSVNIL